MLSGGSLRSAFWACFGEVGSQREKKTTIFSWYSLKHHGVQLLPNSPFRQHDRGKTGRNRGGTIGGKKGMINLGQTAAPRTRTPVSYYDWCHAPCTGVPYPGERLFVPDRLHKIVVIHSWNRRGARPHPDPDRKSNRIQHLYH